MRMALKFLLALLVAGFSPIASAMTLGEGQIQSHVGEPFSANIALPGGYSRDVSFFQVRNAECRSSVIGASENGCDSLYEGKLSFSVRRRADGQYFLRVTGDKDDELFYRIVIKSVSLAEGVVYNAFEFLPEFKANSDVQPGLAEAAQSVDKVTGENPIDDEHAASVAHRAGPIRARPARTEPTDEKKRIVRPVETTMKKPGDTRLKIKKYGEYADDIYALQKENGEIEEQIALLEKHIGLLKEVVRLKNQVDAPAETVAAAPKRIPVQAPSLPPVSVEDEPGLLSWILLAVILVLSTLILLMYRKQLKLTSREAGHGPIVLTPPSLNERKSLDLTGSFVKPKW